MTTIERTSTYPTPVRAGDDRFTDLAARIGAVAGRHAAEHDRDATFVAEAYAAMREHGYLTLAVPTDLGGLGATTRQACYAQAELAKHDGASALSVAMHTYLTLVQVLRRRLGAPDAEGVLRKVADGMVMATSGGSDWLWPTTTATPHDDGFLINGRKAFCSQSTGATALATCAVLGDEVLHFSVPFAADGVRIEQTWDTLGMRGTASNEVVLDDVFVPAGRITGTRPFGEFGVPLLAAAINFAPIVAATYLGIAIGARDAVVAGGKPNPRGVGLMDTELRCAWWALLGALDELGEDYRPEPAALATVMTAKRQAVTAAIRVVDTAMETLGGRSFFKKSPVERAFRDVRAGVFHPFTPEATLSYVGNLALGDSGVSE